MNGLVPKVRTVFEEAFRQGLEAVEPGDAVRSELESRLIEGSVTIVAIGKAAVAMTRGAHDALGSRISCGVVISHGPQSGIEWPLPSELRYFQAGHPFPDVASMRAGRAALFESARARGTLLVLMSGGASALAEVPADGLTLSDLIATYEHLLRAGLPIEQVNTVRRHLSAFKNGGLLDVTHAVTVSLLVADVVNADASVIGSGPTMRDSSTPADALAILEGAALIDLVPAAVVETLRNPERRRRKARHHEGKVVVDGTSAARAASEHIRRSGFEVEVRVEAISGDAADESRKYVVANSSAAVVVCHGETTVRVRGESPGGRNQHAALAAAIALDGREAVFAALATDGRDGLTDSAGAIVDGGTCQRMRAAGIDPEDMLEQYRSHEALTASGDLLITGPTGTNVADLWMSWQQPAPTESAPTR